MSKTPRTDEHLRVKEENGHTVIVSREFAEQLETELAEARAEIERLQTELRQTCEHLGESPISGDHCEGCHDFSNYQMKVG